MCDWNHFPNITLRLVLPNLTAKPATFGIILDTLATTEYSHAHRARHLIDTVNRKLMIRFSLSQLLHRGQLHPMLVNQSVRIPVSRRQQRPDTDPLAPATVSGPEGKLQCCVSALTGSSRSTGSLNWSDRQIDYQMMFTISRLNYKLPAHSKIKTTGFCSSARPAEFSASQGSWQSRETLGNRFG